MFLLKGGHLIDPQVDLDRVSDILISDEGLIERVGVDIEPESSMTTVDVSSCYVVPGLVDMHVHFRDPGYEYKETVEGGCRSAAKGGYTDVCTMPNTLPVCDEGSVVTYQISKAQKTGLARVHPIGALTKGEKGDSLAEIGDLNAAGACAYSDDGRGVQTAGMLRCAMDYVVQFDQTVISHCQDESLAGKGVVNEGRVSARLGLEGWPAQAEELQITRDILLSELTGCRLHIAHVTTRAGVDMVRAAKARGVRVSCEVTPHHLFLCEDDISDDYDTNLKMNPPLRTKEDMLFMQEALCEGLIDCIVSDHAPHAAHEKDLEFELAPFGIVGLETELPLVLTYLVNPGRLSWKRLVETMCINPRAICRLDPVMIRPGCEATLSVIAPDAPFVVSEDFLESKAKNSPYLGRKLAGRALYAYVEGKAILERGEVVQS